MRILCMSDIHAEFERFAVGTLPDADLVIIAGDITNYGTRRPAEVRGAEKWRDALTVRYPWVNYVLGNHDMDMPDDYLDDHGFGHACHSIDITNALQVTDGEDCLICTAFRFSNGEDVTIIGVSLSPCFDMPKLADMWARTTADRRADISLWEAAPAAHIVVSHCPPFGILDSAGQILDPVTASFGEERHIGSPGLFSYIERHKPRLVVCGHAHTAAGVTRHGSTSVAREVSGIER